MDWCGPGVVVPSAVAAREEGETSETEENVQPLTGGAGPRPERGAGQQHREGLAGDRHRRERQRGSYLGGRRGQQGEPEDQRRGDNGVAWQDASRKDGR